MLYLMKIIVKCFISANIKQINLKSNPYFQLKNTIVLAATYFPRANAQVSSALEGLTAEFGMGSGMTLPLKPPEQWCLLYRPYREPKPTDRYHCKFILLSKIKSLKNKSVGKSNDLLVPLGSIHCWTYTCGLSRLYSLTSL